MFKLLISSCLLLLVLNIGSIRADYGVHVEEGNIAQVLNDISLFVNYNYCTQKKKTRKNVRRSLIVPKRNLV